MRPASTPQQVEASIAAYAIRKTVQAILSERQVDGQPTPANRAFRQAWQDYLRRNELARRSYRGRMLDRRYAEPAGSPRAAR